MHCTICESSNFAAIQINIICYVYVCIISSFNNDLVHSSSDANALYFKQLCLQTAALICMCDVPLERV